MKKTILWLLMLLCMTSVMATAGTLSYAPTLGDCASLGLPNCAAGGAGMANGPATTAWNPEFTPVYPKYNGALPLLSITFTLRGSINSVWGAENISPSASSSFTNVNIGGTVTYKRNNNTVVVQVLPAGSTGTFTLTTYDGTEDFDGDSGILFDNLTDTKTNSFLTSAAQDLLDHTGPGTFSSWSISAEDFFSQSGGGGALTTTSETQASAILGVTYTFADSEVPEPTTSALAGGALLLLGFFGRRFRR